MAPRRLLCIIAGEPALFRVQTTGSMDIIDLKILIKENRKNGTLLNVDATDLAFWKVRITMASDSTPNSPAG